MMSIKCHWCSRELKGIYKQDDDGPICDDCDAKYNWTGDVTEEDLNLLDDCIRDCIDIQDQQDINRKLLNIIISLKERIEKLENK